MTTAQRILLGLVPAAYVLGSVPFGLLIGLAKGVDVRKGGSGNIGASNVGRLLGGRFFALVLLLDAAKSLVPMLAGAWAVYRYDSQHSGDDWVTYLLWLMVGFAAILGHMYSIFLNFRGGKGVATSAGVILGLYPYYTLPAVVAIGVWLLVFEIWRYTSLASMVGAAVFPLCYLGVGLGMGWPVFGRQWPLLVFAVVMGGLVVYRHRSNIARLRAGTESRFERKKPLVKPPCL